MALNFTGKVDQNYELIEKGDYEVILNCEYKKTNAGANYINCKFQIRNDVEQSFGGRYVFDSIYKNAGTGDYNKTKINAILAAIPNAKLDFDDYDELVQYLNGQLMVITVDIEPANQYHPNSDKNIVKYLSYRPSEVGGETAPAASAPEDDWQPVDGDLPF
nr:MAG TPA: Protein of unknown function (DUF669) [Caudoviricetes sp.]